MSLSLPPPTSPLRDLFDVKDLAEFGTAEGLAKCPILSEANIAARNAMACDPAIVSVNSILLDAYGCICMYLFSRNDQPYLLWNFGKPF